VLVALAPPLAAWPYLFTNPLQIQIVDYTYFSKFDAPILYRQYSCTNAHN